jgi:hypothetical protein
MKNSKSYCTAKGELLLLHWNFALCTLNFELLRPVLSPPTLNDIGNIGFFLRGNPLIVKFNVGAVRRWRWVVEQNANRQWCGVSNDERFSGAKGWEDVEQTTERIRNEFLDVVLICWIGKAERDKIVALRQNCFGKFRRTLADDHTSDAVLSSLLRNPLDGAPRSTIVLGCDLRKVIVSFLEHEQHREI